MHPASSVWNGSGPASIAAACDLLLGRRVTAVRFENDVVEIHFDDVVLTGLTKPFGIIGCQAVGPATLPLLVHQTVDHVEVVLGVHVAVDARESRVAFPLGDESRDGSEAVRLCQPGRPELGVPAVTWIW